MSNSGCESCRSWPPPRQIAMHPSGLAFLHRCEHCGAYWEFDPRKAVIISDDEAQRRYASVPVVSPGGTLTLPGRRGIFWPIS